MRALGFGTALMNRSSVILIDETPVWVTPFSEKRLAQHCSRSSSKTGRLLVSHAEPQIKQLSSRVALLEKGKILST